ncbi:condensation domain-containing protein [Paracoccus lutimaris]|uniref:Condensation domain-containing protein n=1 Tax=Paracoccus lutimaris TaxID=1490030 RepID=A0A368Z8N4_9RHOB|nr:condensation domain-containing protein [Paracoccus lutimaris]RCW88168.1 condensation domain-containing protein [Paracoccus lutimaris]
MNTRADQFDRSTPLTEAQEVYWRMQVRDPGNPILNTGLYLELLGALDSQAIMQAVTRTIADMPTLSLRFLDPGDGPRQAPGPPLMLGFADLSAQPDAEKQALELMQADSRRPLRLAEEPAAALTFFVIDLERHFLYLRIHHLAIDCYGMVLVANRIAAHYAALVQDAPLPEPPHPLSLAIDEDAAYRNSARRVEDRNWWHSQLAHLPKAIGPAVSGHDYLRARRELPAGLLETLTAFAQTHRLIWADVLRALAGAYLARRTGGEAVIGLPYPARLGQQMAAVPCTIANVLPYYLRLDEDAPLPDWLARQSARMVQGRHHGRYRSEVLRRELGLTGRARLFGPVVKVQPFEKPPEFPGLSCRLHILGAGAVDDLILTFRGEPPSGMVFDLDGNPALYSIEELHEHGDRIEAFLDAALHADRLARIPADDGRAATSAEARR